MHWVKQGAMHQTREKGRCSAPNKAGCNAPREKECNAPREKGVQRTERERREERRRERRNALNAERAEKGEGENRHSLEDDFSAARPESGSDGGGGVDFSGKVHVVSALSGRGPSVPYLGPGWSV